MSTPRLTDFAHVGALRVDLDLGGPARTLGRLAWRKEERVSYFEFDPAFLDDPLPVSPFKLPARPGVVAAPRGTFEGLHGLFNDSLPDGWGRRLLDRGLQRRGYDHRSLTPLDRLAAVGGRGMGALRFVPEIQLDDRVLDGPADVDWLAGQARLAEDDVPEADVDTLRLAEGSSGGARPKVVIAYSPEARTVRYDAGGALPDGFSHWLLKFGSRDDPPEIGPEEFAYALMARAAGIAMSDVDLVRTKAGAYFAVRRFDRVGTSRRHVHTASGLLDADHRVAGALDYGTLLRLTNVLTRDARQVAQVYRRMAFNVLAHNRDDHAKNHAFMMRPDGSWGAAPAYDLTFSVGPAGEHNLAVAGEGRQPDERHMLTVAGDAGIPATAAKAVIAEVADCVDRWPEFADAAGLSRRRTSEIDAVLNRREPRSRPEPGDRSASWEP